MNTNREPFTHWRYSLVAFLLLAAGAAQAQTVQVTSADPSSALQGTVSLDVAVTGNGFDSTALVQFLVTGTTNPGGITVKKVAVRGSKKLIATIDVADTAVVDKFDIVVTLSDGRNGKGTTLFKVEKKVSDPCEFGAMTYEGNWEGFPAFAYVFRRTPLDSTREIRLSSRNGLCSKQVGELQAGVSSLSFLRVGSRYVLAWVADNWNVRLMWFETGQTQETASYIPATSILFRDRAHYVDLSPDGTSLAYQWDTPGTGEVSQIRTALLSELDATGANDTVVYQAPYFPKGVRDVWWAPWSRIYFVEYTSGDTDLFSIDPSVGLDPAPIMMLHVDELSTPVVGQLTILNHVDGGYLGARPVVAIAGTYVASVKGGGKYAVNLCGAIYLIDAESQDFVLGQSDVPSPLKGEHPSMTDAGHILTGDLSSACGSNGRIMETSLDNLQTPVSIWLTDGFGAAALREVMVP